MRVPYLFERIKRPGAVLTGMGRARLIAIPLQPFAGDPNRFLVRWGGGDHARVDDRSRNHDLFGGIGLGNLGGGNGRLDNDVRRRHHVGHGFDGHRLRSFDDNRLRGFDGDFDHRFCRCLGHDLDGWRRYMSGAGFVELTHYYRPPGLPREQQNWLASVWRRPAD